MPWFALRHHGWEFLRSHCVRRTDQSPIWGLHGLRGSLMPLTLFKISVPVWPTINTHRGIKSDRSTSGRERQRGRDQPQGPRWGTAGGALASGADAALEPPLTQGPPSSRAASQPRAQTHRHPQAAPLVPAPPPPPHRPPSPAGQSPPARLTTRIPPKARMFLIRSRMVLATTAIS